MITIFIMSDIVGLMVMKNEADRYLADCISHQQAVCDRIIVFDDCSTDDSVKIANDLGCEVFVREESHPSFMEHEGQFRQAAWDLLQNFATSESWIFAFDADEFFVGQTTTSRRAMERLIEEADRQGFTGVTIPVAEVFGFQADGNPMIRTDGYWGDISGLRLVKYLPGQMLDKSMASGSVPPVSTKLGRKDIGTILHYGYANPEDKYIKFERYMSKSDNGHSSSHVLSILTEPALHPWKGPIPSLVGWR